MGSAFLVDLTSLPSGTPVYLIILSIASSITVAFINSRGNRVMRVIRHQVENTHTTNLREDLDEIHNDVRGIRQDIGELRGQLREVREETHEFESDVRDFARRTHPEVGL